MDRIRETRVKGAETLDLTGLGLTEIPDEISTLTSLSELRVGENRLTEFPAEILGLKALKTLFVGGNYLTSLPRDIGRLQKLEELFLGFSKDEIEDGVRYFHVKGNQLSQLPTEIGQLGKLQYLDLIENQLAKLPTEIGQLGKLQHLVLASNQLVELPVEIGQLGNLQHVDLSDNQLSELPAVIGQLGKLHRLDLNKNQLTKLPAEIGQLGNLQYLGLVENQLSQLPSEIRQLGNLKQILLHRNETLNLPPEILGTEVGWDNRSKTREILEYYFRTRTEPSEALMEAKILVVGQGAVGKSSLVKRLVEDTFDPNEPKTEGIDIVRWSIPSQEPSEQIRANIWDFGGQEIMHATHEFFLTRRSLYILVLDARKGENESNLHYWLRIIQTYGGDAPVLVAVNKSEPPNLLELNETRLRKDYAPNIRGFFSTSCSENLGLSELRQAIVEQVQTLEHVYSKVPASFLATKQALEDRTESEDYLEVRAYEELCIAQGIEKKSDQQLLLRFLHDLGSVLHFADPGSLFRLEETKILNPRWVTEGVYRILNSNLLMKLGGVLTLELLDRILTAVEGYPKTERLFILGMMCKFELCFEFADGTGRYLVPELLSPREPELGFDGLDVLRFEYHYEVLPEGVIPRFIVRTHEHLTAKPTYWRSGVLLQIDNNQVLVRGDTHEGRVYVAVDGPPAGRRRALTAVRAAFAGIHRTVSGRGVEERVALPGYPGESVSYDYLLRLEAKGERTFFPEKVDQRFNVRELLEGIELTAERGRRRPAIGISEAAIAPRPPQVPEVFLSYAWGGESEEIIEEVQATLERLPLQIRRDKHDVHFKHSIRGFMNRLGEGKAVVAVITDRYLKSKYCMYELMTIFETGRFRDRIFPVVAPDATIQDAEDLVDYLLFWEEKRDKLDEKLARLKGRAHVDKLQADLSLYDKIRDLLTNLADELRDMNTLSAEEHRKTGFAELTDAVAGQLGLQPTG